MGTPSIIAIPYGDSWRGRSSHWDGYPTWAGKNVWAIVQRDGVEKASRTLTETYYGWSQLNSERPDISKVKLSVADKKLDRWDLQQKYGRNHPKTILINFDNGGRFVNIPGYGVAYTHEVIPHLGNKYQQSEESDWFGPHEKYGIDARWAFVLADDAFWVLDCDDEKSPILVGQYRWDEPEPDWKLIEEGAYA